MEISQWCGGTVASCGAVLCVCAGSSFGTPARRPEPCRVIDKRPGSVMMELSGLLCGFLLAVALPTHSETHQNATSHLIRPEFLSHRRPARLLLSFFRDRPGKRNDDGNTWRPEFTKKPLWRSVRAREKETKLSAVKGGNKSRVVRCGSV